jgi:hypothetical protein|nr:MAG TPA: hypothetical protein [Caudoviricetes sp.]
MEEIGIYGLKTRVILLVVMALTIFSDYTVEAQENIKTNSNENLHTYDYIIDPVTADPLCTYGLYVGMTEKEFDNLRHNKDSEWRGFTSSYHSWPRDHYENHRRSPRNGVWEGISVDIYKLDENEKIHMLNMYLNMNVAPSEAYDAVFNHGDTISKYSIKFFTQDRAVAVALFKRAVNNLTYLLGQPRDRQTDSLVGWYEVNELELGNRLLNGESVRCIFATPRSRDTNTVGVWFYKSTGRGTGLDDYLGDIYYKKTGEVIPGLYSSIIPGLSDPFSELPGLGTELEKYPGYVVEVKRK